MKSLLILLIAFDISIGNSIAVKSGSTLSEPDIQNSTTRILHSFSPNSRKNIIEQGIPVGESRVTGEEFYMTYRPSLGLEIFNCTDKRALSLSSISRDIGGAGHQGLTQLFSKKDIEDTVIKPFMDYKKETRLPTEQLTIFVEGMSAGAH